MHPNKPTIIAATIYALSKPEGIAKKQPLLWGQLSDEQKAPFTKLADFLGQYIIGSQLTETDRTKLAAVFSDNAKGTPAEKADAVEVVGLFLTLSHLLAL